jgi:ABC-type antimicrobial peptide transport system permease subunit
MALVVRTADDALALGMSLRQAVASIDTTVPVSEIRTADRILATSVAAPRFTALLLATFAALALGLAAVGIYAVVSVAVSGRTREIGSRMALGAGRRDVRRGVVGRAVLLAVVGTVAGLGAALLLTRGLQSLLFEVSRTDVLTFTLVPVLLVGVAAAAAYIPARRATRIDPVSALRLD